MIRSNWNSYAGRECSSPSSSCFGSQQRANELDSTGHDCSISDDITAAMRRGAGYEVSHNGDQDSSDQPVEAVAHVRIVLLRHRFGCFAIDLDHDLFDQVLVDSTVGQLSFNFAKAGALGTCSHGDRGSFSFQE